MQKNNSGLSKIQAVTAVAMLTALSVIIGIICKNFLTFNVYYRITFENFPILLAGIVFGPVLGALCGACADIVSCLCSSNPMVIPLITLGAASVGFLSGLVSKYIIKKQGALNYAVSIAVAHIVGQVLIKSVAKIIWLGMPKIGVILGIAISIIVGTVEFFGIRFIIKRGILPGVSKSGKGSNGV